MPKCINDFMPFVIMCMDSHRLRKSDYEIYIFIPTNGNIYRLYFSDINKYKLPMIQTVNERKRNSYLLIGNDSWLDSNERILYPWE